MRHGCILGPISGFFNTPFSLLMRHMRMAHGLPNPCLYKYNNNNNYYTMLFHDLITQGHGKQSQW